MVMQFRYHTANRIQGIPIERQCSPMLNTDVAWGTRGVCTGRGSRAPPRDALTARYIVAALSGGPWPYTETQYVPPLLPMAP